MMKKRQISMISHVKWFLMPIVVLASAPIFAILGWFQSEYFFMVFSVIGLFLLIIWRRATYRLEPSLRNVKRETIDDQTNRLLTKCVFITMGGAFTVSTVVLFFLIAFLIFPAASSWTEIVLLLVIMFWTSIVRFGAINILTHIILVHALSNRI